jgi:hypothetical protein
MKKYKLIILTALAASLLTACSDDDFSKLYEDPGKTTTVSCDKLMTGVFYDAKGYIFNAYWRMYTWDNIFAKYTQTVGYKNNSGAVYAYNDGYANDRWESFYLSLAQFRQLENKYNSESETEQANDRIFKDLAEVVVYDQLAQIVSVFGDAPFTKAGYIGITGDATSARPAYDDDVELYRTMLSRLGELYTDISSIQSSVTSLVSSSLTSQDFINGGDLSKWKAYTNSLRLRIAVNVASQGDLTNEARSAIQECLSRDLVTSDDNAIEVSANNEDTELYNSDDVETSFRDINNVASQPMIDAMTRVNGTEDPRLRVIYSPNKDGQFVGTNRTETNDEQTQRGSAFNGFGNGAWSDRYYAYLDSATFTGNRLLISPIMTAAEVDFLRAECYQNGWATGDAKAAFISGVVNSTKFYYRQNNTYKSKYGYVGTYPGDATVQAYAEKLWDTYDNKIEAIMTQKWVNFGVMQAPLAWNDIRRTGYPVLSYPTDTQAQSLANLPNRIKYPNAEKANNAANYATETKVQADEWTTKLFWAK